MKRKIVFLALAIITILAALFIGITQATAVASSKLSFSPQIVASTSSSNGTLFAGDTNYTLYKSNDNGQSFNLTYKFTSQTKSTFGFTGYVMMLFIDSIDQIFVSIPGTSRLYRSVDFGLTFTEVLRTNGSVGDGFFVAMSEDQDGNLYTATYCNSDPNYPQCLKSSDGGLTWKTTLICSTAHIHNVKVNPNNGFLYVIGGEYAQANRHGNIDSEKVFRSKDAGATWAVMVERNATNPRVYSVMQFYGNWTYLGSDMAYSTNFIDRFYDDGVLGKDARGNGSTVPLERIYMAATSDGQFPFVSACWCSKTLYFSTTSEFSSGTARIISSTDGLTWTVTKNASYTTLQHHGNMLTSNPNNVMLGSDGQNQNFAIIIQSDPTSTPTEKPFPSAVVTPIYTPTTPQSIRTPTPTLKPSAAPTMQPTPTLAPTQSPTSTSTGSTLKLTSEKPLINTTSITVIVMILIAIIASIATWMHKTKRHKQLSEKEHGRKARK